MANGLLSTTERQVSTTERQGDDLGEAQGCSGVHTAMARVAAGRGRALADAQGKTRCE
jgi:hypothetical protein